MDPPVDTPIVVATASETKARVLLIRSNDQVDGATLGVENMYVFQSAL